MTLARHRLVVTGLNAFWIFIWIPGLLAFLRRGEPMRVEDWLNPGVLLLGVVLQWLTVRPGVWFNASYYAMYAVRLMVLAAADAADVHQGFAVVLIGIPYLLSAALILFSFRALRRQRDTDLRRDSKSQTT